MTKFIIIIKYRRLLSITNFITKREKVYSKICYRWDEKYHHSQGNYCVLKETCVASGTESYQTIPRTSFASVLAELVRIEDKHNHVRRDERKGQYINAIKYLIFNWLNKYVNSLKKKVNWKGALNKS